MAATSYLIALGSNRRHPRHGRPAAVVAAGHAALATLGDVTARSATLDSRAVGPGGRHYANAAAILDTGLAPTALLSALKAIERDFGRRRGRRWGERVIDLDIILWSGGRMRAPELTVPHPMFRGRDFVLTPATAIAADWRDPDSGLTVRQLARRLTARRPKPR